MGTRHLIAVKIDGDYKIAQYGQWDGYLKGQGIEVLRFLHGMDQPGFMAKCRAAKWVDDEALKKLWVECGAKLEDRFVSMDVARVFADKYPEFDRDTGSKILSIVAERDPGILLHNHISFASDSLFCEFAYVIDFDTNTFEVFRGFNKRPLGKNQRFAGFPPKPKPEGRENLRTYYPVRLWKKFDLRKLPSQEEFLNSFKEKK